MPVGLQRRQQRTGVLLIDIDTDQAWHIFEVQAVAIAASSIGSDLCSGPVVVIVFGDLFACLTVNTDIKFAHTMTEFLFELANKITDL
eukprot:COSAG01_NODE_52553_length_346_cov_0.465587_1_plen_87_part_10